MRFPAHMDRATGVLIIFGVCLLAAGCGGGGDVDLAPVTGTVTMDGKPLPNATVTYQPADGTGSPSTAKTDEQGNYTLQYTFDQEGALIGEHVVGISTEGTRYDEETDEETSVPETVPAKYNVKAKENPEMKVTVAAEGGHHEFKLDSSGEIIQPRDGDDRGF